MQVGNAGKKTGDNVMPPALGDTLETQRTGRGNTEGTETPASRRTEGTEFETRKARKRPAGVTEDTEGRFVLTARPALGFSPPGVDF